MQIVAQFEATKEVLEFENRKLQTCTMIYEFRFLILFLLMMDTDSIVVKNGGYEDVYIYVQDTNEESQFLLQRIKEVFTEASNLMFMATKQRLYFKRIRIVIPKSWSLKPEYKRMPVPTPFKQYIIVNRGGIEIPHTRGLEVCGKEATYMYLNAKDFLLKKGFTNWGFHDRVIVHEWGHFRWGIFDEYPVHFPFFYQADGKWKPVSCTQNIKGRLGTGSQCKAAGKLCNRDDTGKTMNSSCKFCPTLTQSLDASLMNYAYLNKVSMFCDKDDNSVDKLQRHNRLATNLQNKYCEHRSAWEIMRTHKDFQDKTALPLSTNTTPEFVIVQGSEIFRVFVLDISGSMNDDGKLVTLRHTGIYVIQEVIMDGSWLGIVTFSSSAGTARNLTQIKSQADRDELKDALPTAAGGATCIGCGIEEAIRILKLVLGDPENAEIVVISDGENGSGDIQSSIQKAVQEKVIVHTIAVTQEADTLLVDIAQKTGGKHYTYLQTGSIGFAASFSETITGDLTSAKSRHVMLLSERIDLTSFNLVQFNFTIEDGIGSNTSVTVITKSDQNVNIELSGPNNFTQTLNSTGSYATLLISGIAMAGQYEVRVSLQQNHQPIEYYVKSTPTSEDIIKTTSWLSTSGVDFLSDELPTVFVDVRKGFTPVKNANVTVRAESFNSSCEFALTDNGKDPDVIANDGIYSGYLSPDCLRSGRVNAKAYVRGEAGKSSLIRNVNGAPAIEEVDEDPEIYNESFQRVQVLEELFVTNYSDPGSKDITSPNRITDVNIYNIVSETTQYGESRNFTITWTAPGDDKNVGQASEYMLRISDDLDILLHNFDDADLLKMENTTLTPQEAGMTEALKIVVDAEQSYTKTAFFAVKSVDESGNTGKVSNIVPIVVADGYRASGEKGSLEIVTVDFPETTVNESTDTNAIIGGTVGGVAFVMICLLVLFFCRRQTMRETKGEDFHMRKF